MPIHKKPLSALPSVRQLRALVAVHGTGSISAAARELALTQPAVTVLLRELEDRLGLKLFDRSTRVLRPTAAAAEAVGHAQRALAELEAMAAGMAQLAAAGRGRVRVAATAIVAQSLVPAAMGRYRDLHPGVKVELEEVAPDGFVEALLAERVDFGVGTLESPVAGLREEVLLRDVLVAAALPGAGFAAGSSITWKQLAALPVVTVRPGYGVRRRIDEAAQAAGVTLRIEHEVALLSTAVAMAEHGLAAAIVPGSILASGATGSRLVARRITRPAVQRPIAVVAKRDRSLSPAAQALAEVLRAVAAA
jgi:DNA-binding transcriptional LysR family regulator